MNIRRINIALIFMVGAVLLLNPPLYSIGLSKATYLRPPLKYAVWATKSIKVVENVARFSLYGSIGEPLAENTITPFSWHDHNGEILLYKDRFGVLLVGSNGTGKSSLAFTALGTSKDWQAVAPNLSSISLATDNNSGNIILIGKALMEEISPIIFSRLYEKKNIKLVYPQGVFIHYIVAFGSRSLEESFDVSFESVEVEVIRVSELPRTLEDFQKLCAIITEHIQRTGIEAPGSINDRLPHNYSRTCP